MFLLSRGHADVLPFINDRIARDSTITKNYLLTYNILNSMRFNNYRINNSRYLVALDSTKLIELKKYLLC